MSKFKAMPDILQKEFGRGIQITFDNGTTISIMFGNGNYCSNNHGLHFEDVCTVSPNAEIAMWDKDGKWHTFDSDQVKGYCTADEVAEWIAFAQSHDSFDYIPHFK